MMRNLNLSMPKHLTEATLREMGYRRAAALDGGMMAWSEAGYPVKEGREPQDAAAKTVRGEQA